MYTLVCVIKCGTFFKHYFLNFSFSIFLESPICLCFLESWRWCSRGLPEGHISSSILPLLRLDNITWSFLKLSDVYLLPAFNYFWQFFNLSSYTWFSTKIFNLSVNSENYILFYFFSIFWFSLHEKTSFSHFFLFLPHGFLWFLTDLRHCTLESLPIKNMPFHLKFLPPDTCQAFLYSYTYHFIQN